MNSVKFQVFPNLNKSTLFFGSLKGTEKEQIMNIMQFKEGTLPSKYIGVPLVTKRLGVKECKVLVDKIKSRIEDWKNKYLSYAGRLLLIADVLESMSVYWASIFRLPKTVVKEINNILKRFLWSNGDSAKGKAKIAWKYICRPKECGGLGIRNLESWNVALLAKLLWNIASKKDTLWVKDKIGDRMQYEIGDGSKVYLWYDEWHSSGLLINQVTNRDLYDARIPKMISIAEMIKEGVWNWPDDWDSNEFEFIKLRVPHITNAVNDKVMWRDDDNKLVPFHFKHVMEVINPSTDKNHGIGTHSGLLCPLCNKENDSHKHLFFSCHYSKDVWRRIAAKMNLRKIDFIWEEVIDEILKNQRLFQGIKRDIINLTTEISDIVKLKLMNIIVKDFAAAKSVADVWDIQLNKSH
ncbi:RNA-directed DNA polymerase, eukaryota, reverse transcriptase zinc-binding domain protein [Tanacetum coccineum]